MLWFKKQPEQPAKGGESELIIPVPLAVSLDVTQFQHKLSALQHSIEDDGGVEVYLSALRAKQDLFVRALSKEKIDSLNQADLEELLETVFSARRRVYSDLISNGMETVALAMRELIYGLAPLEERMHAFSMLVSVDESAHREVRKQAEKTRRAALDFAAELLHFNAPERYPLMCRWVWDQNTVSGALREFIRGNDHMPDVKLGTSPGIYEGARVWMAEQVSANGVYKDIHFWVDLILAQAYTEYFRSLAEGMLGSDFGRGTNPSSHIRKFLGIDAPIREGVSRIKRDASI